MFFRLIIMAMIANKKTIILNLIVEDFCMQQLLHGMENIGFTTLHENNLYKIVAGLMELDPEEIPDSWLNTYYSYYEKACNVKYYDRKDLFILANRCLKELIIINIFSV